LIKGRPWSEAEDKAMLRRLKAGETQKSVGLSLGRTLSAIMGRKGRKTNKNFASQAGEQPRTHDRSIGWRYEAQAALRRLGGKGTASEIIEEAEKAVRLQLSEKHKEVAPGEQAPRWHMRLNFALSQNEEFERTEEKAPSTFDGGMRPVWRLNEALAPEAPEVWADGKPKERKFKWLNARERT
tara:strand:+ start:1006 stop:1554 length:549 start_codon:yes stop_codon:yes gene_type:complete